MRFPFLNHAASLFMRRELTAEADHLPAELKKIA